MSWAVEFDWRADDGPDLVGPFAEKTDAGLWLLALDIGGFEANYREIAAP